MIKISPTFVSTITQINADQITYIQYNKMRYAFAIILFCHYETAKR